MSADKAVRAILLAVGILGVNFSVDARLTKREHRQLTLTEAEILIYLLPQGKQLREQQMQLGWEVEESADWNGQDYYFFFVFNGSRTETGSYTIGHFAVNKHTADVWNTPDADGQMVTGREIEDVQEIIRKTHNIDEGVTSRYRKRPFYRR